MLNGLAHLRFLINTCLRFADFLRYAALHSFQVFIRALGDSLEPSGAHAVPLSIMQVFLAVLPRNISRNRSILAGLDNRNVANRHLIHLET